MLHRKETPFKSVPVSRVSSSQRLNQLGSNPHPSIPTTPVHVSSSLNPIRNLPVNPGNYRSKITNRDELKRFEELPIVHQVTEFERLLGELSSSISSFKDDGLVKNVESMIHVNEDLKAKIADLQSHRELGKQIEKLNQENISLEAKSKHILKELISYRSSLKELPRRPASKKVVANDVDVSEVLKYAMKLAKFTKAPVANAQFTVHPNNYVWPAEDALRRGMLAASSLQEDAIIKNELGEEDVEMAKEVVAKEEAKEEDKAQEREEEKPGRRSSFGDYGAQEAEQPKQEESGGLDLDLFDPDDEFSD
ncbi:uncharacterized protein CANTADRAFT_339424 [Suhomyces tanzawaensis NRRL Y-17324]|uniref:Mediator of RNA polymerase II transcription subunit 4 n=1 Tax=Suhomyces tanzawaensis NRRL Y-17324 TaxID=984487 RepID=A0A1E4SKX9_9ASCO|nr:uncharacterized protein CANTADRAFT_339424 [Suhomyces tanzawaensis NRRL Y-17324]ODV80153.1 hypothetical protein CANTADRAFT_339424 [Suhomyces tanzawaensis NRRL Y-17324]